MTNAETLPSIWLLSESAIEPSEPAAHLRTNPANIDPVTTESLDIWALLASYAVQS